MSDIADMIQRNSVNKILDGHIGSANAISQKEWYKLSFLTLDTLRKPLLNSFGKYASNSLIIHNNVSTSSVFTQDGIHIVSAFEFASLIQEYIAKHVQYIGERVEKSARDGTTTAMLLFIGILYKIYEDFNIFIGDSNAVSFEDINFTLYQYTQAIKEILQGILEYIKDIKVDIKSTKEHGYTKEEIIYKLSYITSKGNKELSKIMVDMFKDIPNEIYDYFVYYRSEIETNKPFEIYTPEYEYEFNTLVRSGRAYFNSEVNTIFKGNVDLILISETLFDSDIKKIKDIETRIESSNRNLIIIWNTINEKLISIWEEKFKNKKIIMLQYVNYVQNLRDSGIELNGLLKGSYKTKDNCFIEDVNVYLSIDKIGINNFLEFDNLVNKFYHQKDSEFYKYVNDIKLYIKKLRNAHIKSDVAIELKEITKIFRKLIAPKYPILRIGGNTLDHLSMIDVVEDTVGALTVAFDNGIVIDGLNKINEYLKYEYSKYVKKNTKDNEIKMRVCEIIRTNVNYLNNLSIDKRIEKHEIIIQNYMTFKETFTRLLEVLPKLITSTSVIVPGTVSLNKSNK